jgi:hypothetical protein
MVEDLRVLKELGGLVSFNVGCTVEKFVEEEKTSSPKGKVESGKKKVMPKKSAPAKKTRAPAKKSATKKTSKPAAKKKKK